MKTISEILNPAPSSIIPACEFRSIKSPNGSIYEAKIAIHGGPVYPVALIAEADLISVRELVSDFIQVARYYLEVLDETQGPCECGGADCRTTRLRAVIKKATGE